MGRGRALGWVFLERVVRQHRVWWANFPASQGNPAFGVSAVFDEFGREKETTDTTGTTQNGYDVLDRQVSVTPPNPQKALSWAYTKDTTLKRWITTVNVAGVGNYTWRGDTKGRLSELVNPFGQAWWLEYDRDGKNTLVAHPNGVKEERAYTPRDWLASILFRQQNGQVFRYFDYLYTDAGGNYDPTGPKRREIDSLGQVRAFGLNDLYRPEWESQADLGTGRLPAVANVLERLTRRVFPAWAARQRTSRGRRSTLRASAGG